MARWGVYGWDCLSPLPPPACLASGVVFPSVVGALLSVESPKYNAKKVLGRAGFGCVCVFFFFLFFFSLFLDATALCFVGLLYTTIYRTYRYTFFFLTQHPRVPALCFARAFAARFANAHRVAWIKHGYTVFGLRYFIRGRALDVGVGERRLFCW